MGVRIRRKFPKLYRNLEPAKMVVSELRLGPFTNGSNVEACPIQHNMPNDHDSSQSSDHTEHWNMFDPRGFDHYTEMITRDGNLFRDFQSISYHHFWEKNGAYLHETVKKRICVQKLMRSKSQGQQSSSSESCKPGLPSSSPCQHCTQTCVFLLCYRCRKGELFDYLTEVVTLSEKRTR